MIVRGRIWRGTAAGLFFLLYYLYVWLAIDPRLVLHSMGILVPSVPFSFHADFPFFIEHVARVGGLLEYATRLLTQLFAFGWAGALVVTGAVFCLGVCTDWLVHRTGRNAGYVLPCVPAAIVLVMYGGYGQPLGPVLSLVAALGGFAIYVRLAPEAPVPRVVVLVLACLVVYYSAGAAGLLFPVLAAVDEHLVRKQKFLAVAALACAAIIPCAAGLLFGLGFRQAYAGFVLSAPGVAPASESYTLALYLFFPTVLAGSVQWGNVRARDASPGTEAASARPGPKRRSKKGDSPKSEDPRRRSLSPMPLGAAFAAMFFLGAAAAAWLSLDTRLKVVLETDYYAQREQWGEVLRSAEQLPAGVYNLRYNRNIMQALYHTGGLADEMFRYPQRRGVDLFFPAPEQRDLGSYFQESRLFLDLGQVNMAERSAYEALATTGEEPAILRHLALIYVLKGRPKSAEICLHALEKYLFQGNAAREMLRRLKADPTLGNDPQASRIRANMAARDAVAQAINTEEFLQILLERNPHNQMAFELLMAHYLSNGMPEKVVANLSRLKDSSYRRVPRYFQEALAVCSPSSGGPAPVAGLEVDPDVLWRLREFQRIVAESTGPQDALRRVKDADLGNSYFFYLASGVSGR